MYKRSLYIYSLYFDVPTHICLLVCVFWLIFERSSIHKLKLKVIHCVQHEPLSFTVIDCLGPQLRVTCLLPLKHFWPKFVSVVWSFTGEVMNSKSSHSIRAAEPSHKWLVPTSPHRHPNSPSSPATPLRSPESFWEWDWWTLACSPYNLH